MFWFIVMRSCLHAGGQRHHDDDGGGGGSGEDEVNPLAGNHHEECQFRTMLPMMGMPCVPSCYRNWRLDDGKLEKLRG
jgi:hypothetical protein